MLSTILALVALTPVQSVSGNIVPNGDFSQGNTGFESVLPYTEPADNCLWPGVYTIAKVFNRPQLHRLIAIEPFAAPVVKTGKEQVMYMNAGGVAPVNVWTTTVDVQPKTTYRISFLVASLSGHEDTGTPPRQVPTEDWLANFQIGVNRDISPEFAPGLGKFYKASMVWTSGRAKTAKLTITRCRLEHGGGLYALSNIEMVPVPVVANPPKTSGG